jgi:hypothetical protein
MMIMDEKDYYFMLLEKFIEFKSCYDVSRKQDDFLICLELFFIIRQHRIRFSISGLQ